MFFKIKKKLCLISRDDNINVPRMKIRLVVAKLAHLFIMFMIPNVSVAQVWRHKLPMLF